MGIPYSGGGDDVSGWYPDERESSSLPGDWHNDPNHNAFHNYLTQTYGEDFHNYFNWEDWRDSSGKP